MENRPNIYHPPGYGAAEAMSRRDFVRNLAIAGGSLALGAGGTLEKFLIEDPEQAAADEKPAEPEAPAPEIPEPEPQEERAHHHLTKNEHGFYVFGAFGGQTIQPQAIVAHWTAALYSRKNSVGELQIGLLNNPAECGDNGCAYQVFVDRGGIVFQYTEQLNTRAVSAPGMHDTAIGISFEAANEANLLNNQPQYEAGLWAISTIMDVYGIPLAGDVHAKTGLLSHQETDRVYKDRGGNTDPGPTFMAKLREGLAAYSA